MFGRKEVPTHRLEIELTTHCVSRCSECPRTMNLNGARSDPGWQVGHLNPESIYNLIKDGTVFHLNFCGAYGDPIYHPKVLEIATHITHNYPSVHMHFETNGSHRKENWWEELGRILGSRHAVTFSLDGLKDTNALYREGTDWDSIITGVKALRRSFHGEMMWKWIVFRQNQHQVEEGYRLARELGFDAFKLIDSGRHNENSKPTVPFADLEKMVANASLADVPAI